MKDSVSYIAGNTEVYIIYALYKDFLKDQTPRLFFPLSLQNLSLHWGIFLLTAGESSRWLEKGVLQTGRRRSLLCPISSVSRDYTHTLSLSLSLLQENKWLTGAYMYLCRHRPSDPWILPKPKSYAEGRVGAVQGFQQVCRGSPTLRSPALFSFHLFLCHRLCVQWTVLWRRYPRERGNPWSYFSPLHTSLPNKWDPEHANSQPCRSSS